MMKKLFFLSFVLVTACSKKEALHPEVKSLMEAVYASGLVVSDNEYQVFAQAEGVVIRIAAPEGTMVKTGDPIVVLESTQQDSRLFVAQEAYEQARKNLSPASPVLAELDANVSSARSRLTLDSTNYVRYSNLLKANAITRAEYDRIKLAYDNSKNEFALLQSRYKRTRDDLGQALRQTESQWKIARQESGNYVLQSRVDGMVFRIEKENGELVRRNELVAVVGSKDKFRLRLSVDELDIQRIQTGQPVVVRIDAYPGKVFNAVVTEIFPLVDTRQQSVQVDADLTESLPGLFSGLAVEANIVIRKKDNALVIPKSLLVAGDSLWVKTDDGDKKIKVKTGMITLDEVEITEGIEATTSLVPAVQ